MAVVTTRGSSKVVFSMGLGRWSEELLVEISKFFITTLVILLGVWDGVMVGSFGERVIFTKVILNKTFRMEEESWSGFMSIS